MNFDVFCLLTIWILWESWFCENLLYFHNTIVHCSFSRPKYGITEKRDGYRGVMLLVVRSFSPSDVGTYHCVSTNSLGRAEGTLRLYGAYA